jgi:cytochrome c553
MKLSLPVALLLGGALGLSFTAFAADAKTNWVDQCAKCHGEDGAGQTKMGKKLKIRDLTDPAVQATFNDAQALKAMKEGVADESGKQKMKPVEDISEDEMNALVIYLRGLQR